MDLIIVILHIIPILGDMKFHEARPEQPTGSLRRLRVVAPLGIQPDICISSPQPDPVDAS